MHHLLRRISPKRVLFSVDTLVSDALYSSFLAKQHFTASALQNDIKCVKHSIPGNFVKWGSLGFCRTSRFATGFEPLKHKPLDSIMDIERVKDRSAEEITSVWDDFHLGRGHIGTSMKASLYHLLEQRAANCRYFVIPLWKGSGYTTMFVQEFADNKDLVLIRADVVLPSKISDSEAKWLIEASHSFYLNDVRYKLVERFNRETKEFEFKDVLRALEMPNL